MDSAPTPRRFFSFAGAHARVIPYQIPYQIPDLYRQPSNSKQ